MFFFFLMNAFSVRLSGTQQVTSGHVHPVKGMIISSIATPWTRRFPSRNDCRSGIRKCWIKLFLNALSTTIKWALSSGCYKWISLCIINLFAIHYVEELVTICFGVKACCVVPIYDEFSIGPIFHFHHLPTSTQVLLPSTTFLFPTGHLQAGNRRSTDERQRAAVLWGWLLAQCAWGEY